MTRDSGLWRTIHSLCGGDEVGGVEPPTSSIRRATDLAAGPALVRDALDNDRPFDVIVLDAELGHAGRDDLLAADPAGHFVVVADDHDSESVSAGLPTGATLVMRRPVAGADLRLALAALAMKSRAQHSPQEAAFQAALPAEGPMGHCAQPGQPLPCHAGASPSVLPHRDQTTGLLTRPHALEKISGCIERSLRESEYHFALLLVDVDDFRTINEGLGFRYGDQLLDQVARRLRQCLRASDAVVHDDMVARIGTDVFLVIAQGIADQTDALRIADRIQDVLSRPYSIGDHDVTKTVSIGVAVDGRHPQDTEALLRDVDTALHRAKLAGGAGNVLFAPDMHETIVRRFEIERDLRRALEAEALTLHYQPIISLRSMCVAGVEALMRWPHPEHGWISPGEFIPIAEATGLIELLGYWALREAGGRAVAWRDALGRDTDFAICVNVSRRQLSRGDFADLVAATLDNLDLDPRYLRLELTESAVLGDLDTAHRTLQQIRDLGVHLLMDDFGTGYSSLSCLHRLPIDTVKIDRSFVGDIENNEYALAVVETVITLAHQLNMEVVAEGVENERQLAMLMRLECDSAQGYHFARPIPAELAAQTIKAGPEWRRIVAA